VVVYAPQAELRCLLPILASRAIRAASEAELFVVLQTRRIDAVVIHAEPVDAVVVRLVRRCRTRYPALPIYCFSPLEPAIVRQAAALAQAGVNDIVLRGFDDIERLLDGAALAERHAMAALNSVINASARDAVGFVLEHCVRRSAEPLSAMTLADELGMHPKTLLRRLARSGLPGPGALISKCRLLVAGAYLVYTRFSVERVALCLHFGSGAALSNALVRWAGCRPSQLALRGGMTWLVERLFDRRLAP
jgi:AraC-like DNA-binding protein